MFVIDDDRLDTLEGHDHNVADVLHAFLRLFGPIDRLNVESEAFHGPLSSMGLTVFLRIFLDGDIGQVHKHVVYFGDIRRVELVTEPGETIIVYPGLQRAVGSHQH